MDLGIIVLSPIAAKVAILGKHSKISHGLKTGFVLQGSKLPGIYGIIVFNPIVNVMVLGKWSKIHIFFLCLEIMCGIIR